MNSFTTVLINYESIQRFYERQLLRNYKNLVAMHTQPNISIVPLMKLKVTYIYKTLKVAVFQWRRCS